jgi:2-iminobutanoate/2-iminopropanoate deaminase
MLFFLKRRFRKDKSRVKRRQQMTEPTQGRSLEVPGLSHGKTPIPMGARVGNVICSSGIAGKDPITNTLPPDANAQAKLAFDHMQALLKQGGATLADVVRVTVFLKDTSYREAINTQWLQCFPDPHDRPARHALVQDLQGGMLLQIEFMAVIGQAAPAAQ